MGVLSAHLPSEGELGRTTDEWGDFVFPVFLLLQQSEVIWSNDS